METRRIVELRLSPPLAVAGESTVIEIDLSIAGEGISPGAMLLIDCPGYLGASRPQFHYSEEEGYVVVRSSVPDLRWEGGVATHDRSRWLFAREDYAGLTPKTRSAYRLLGIVFPTGIPVGTRLTVLLGASGGGFTPGYKVSTVAPRPGFRQSFNVHLYPSRDAAEPLESHVLEQTLVPRRAARAQVIRPASGGSRLQFWDDFANPALVGDVAGFVDSPAAWRRNGHGAWECSSADIALGVAPPISVADSASMRNVFDGYSLYWGDLHTHSAFSADVRSRERGEIRPGHMFSFAREAAGLDFLAVTDHNHHNVTPRQAVSAAEWEETVAAAEAADEPGRFVALAGMEYRCARGDCAVIFERTPPYALTADPALNPISKLWQTTEAFGPFTIPHLHNPGSLPTGDWIGAPDEALDPVMEVFSCHGRFDEPPWPGMPLRPPRIKTLREDRNGAWLIAKGCRYGVVANSDDHKVRPGTNGLTALFMKSLSRAGVIEALRARRCYGTTNARIRLVFAVDGHLMGSVLPAGTPGLFRVQVAGTSGLQCVDLLRNGQLHRRITPDGTFCDEEWREKPSGAAVFQVRVLQQDQEMAFSSPIWIEA